MKDPASLLQRIIPLSMPCLALLFICHPRSKLCVCLACLLDFGVLSACHCAPRCESKSAKASAAPHRVAYLLIYMILNISSLKFNFVYQGDSAPSRSSSISRAGSVQLAGLSAAIGKKSHEKADVE